MKVVYLTHFDLLRPTTNRISDIRFCEGFSENGCSVEMVAPYVYRSYNLRRSAILEAYGIEYPFKISILPTPLWEGASKWFYVPVVVFLAALTYLRVLLGSRCQWQDTYVVSRDVNLLVPLLCLNKVLLQGRGPKVIHWAHEIKPESAQYRWVYEHVDGIIGTNSAIIDDVHEQVGTARERLAITLNPVSTRQLQEREHFTEDKTMLRQRLGLPADRRLVVYTGKLGPEMREIAYILTAASELPDFTFVFTGGKPSAVRYFRNHCEERGIENVIFTGFLDRYPDVLDYQVAADVLVSYYTTQNHIVDYNYPQKITEYMLAGNPIVTPKYRATQDVLNDCNAFFVMPEDSDSLVDGIKQALTDPERARRIARRAWEDVREITFKNRTRRLMDFFQTL